MTNKSRQPVKPVTRSFLRGRPVDERTAGQAAGFFGVLILISVLTFLVSSAMGMQNSVLRIGANALIVIVVMLIMYSNAISRGTDAVARGEILYQRQEKGQSFTAAERAVCFHPLKGYVTGFLGTLPLLICAIALAVTAQRQTTGIGALPGWLSSYQRRSEIGDALAAYAVHEGITLEEVLRIIVRMAIMPFVTMVGSENRDGLLMVERLSPLLVLLPALAYGTGYLRGPMERTKVHTGIAQSKLARARKERRERKARAAKPRTPQQLN